MRIIELCSGDAVVRIAPTLGAVITSFAFRGLPVLRETPEPVSELLNVRATACYPLVPYSNRMRDARLRFRGTDYTLARNFGAHPHSIHGVGWQRAWSIAGVQRDRLQLTLEHVADAAGAPAWPWPFRATQTFELAHDANGDGAVLAVTLTLANRGASAFPFGLGWHPFFTADATTTVAFIADSMWENDATQLPLRRVDVPKALPFAAARPLAGLAIDNVFSAWNGRAVIINRSTGIRAMLAADRACRNLVVYAPANASFIALEPVTHETDAFNRSEAGAAGTGCRTLPPGCAFSCTMRVAASTLD
ncbi:MAG TPA: aldose 1-epimerase [Casimicrobiaceae bacterium]|nr:aldose 1-epimerase [Casimicrobiaceae bacterium]